MVCAAQALASRVFPVPGGPYIRTPLGGWIPKFSNFSLWFMGRTMASTSCSTRRPTYGLVRVRVRVRGQGQGSGLRVKGQDEGKGQGQGSG